MRFAKFVAVAIALSSFFPARGAEHDSAPASPSDRLTPSAGIRFNPILVTGLSAAVPGSGQLLTGHYVKAGLFLALEGTFLSMTNFWRERELWYDGQKERALANAEAAPAADRYIHLESAELNRHGAVSARYEMYNYGAWAAGAYVYNLLDAYQSTRLVPDTRERSARTAFLLAMVPGLGLGQLYNGRYSKAGMVMMAQWSLGMMSYNYHSILRRAGDNYERFSSVLRTDSLAAANSWAQEYQGRWSGSRSSAFTNRNMYLWYSIFFYAYSIFDAVVDAYLHDYPERMRLSPDLAVSGEKIRFSLTAPFNAP